MALQPRHRAWRAGPGALHAAAPVSQKAIDAAEKGLPAPHIIHPPRRRPLGARLHMARTVRRRAERTMVTLHRDTPLDPRLLEYLNRLFDLLFVLARAANHRAGRREDRW